MNNPESNNEKKTETLSDAEVSNVIKLQEEQLSTIREVKESEKALLEALKRNLPKNKKI